ncbi:MAG: transglycosylase family protein [Patescibacteria group bacterium]
MQKQDIAILLKEKIGFIIFFATLVSLTLIHNQIKAFHSAQISNQKIASPLSKTTPTPTSTPTPSPTPTPTTTPTPTLKPRLIPTKIPLPTSTPTPDPKSPDNPAIWESIADCETHSNWSADTGNGYFGGLQFSQGAWNSVNGAGNPAQASKDEQITRGKMLKNLRGWGVWGACAAKLGLN